MMRPSTKKPQGSTQDCLADYAARFPGESGRQLLMEFFDPIDERKTARPWLKGERMPEGEQLLRLRCFLDLVGYRVEELYALPEVARKLAMLVACRNLTPEDVRAALGYQHAQQVYSVLLRGSHLLPDRVVKLEALVKRHKVALSGATTGWRKRIDEVLAPIEAENAELASVATVTSVAVEAHLGQGLVESIRTTRALCEAASHPGHQVARILRQRVNREEVRQLIRALEHLLE